MTDKQQFATMAELQEMFDRLQADLLPRIPDMVHQAYADKIETMRKELVVRTFKQGLQADKEGL